MLKIYDKDHNAIGHLVKYKDCKVESEVSAGDKSLSFTYLAKHHNLANEMYVRTRNDEYVIKEVSESSDGFPQVVAALNLEELEAQAWQTISFTDITVDEGARTVLAGTGWTVGECNVTKRRNAGMMQVSSLGAIQGLCTAFMCEPVFDTINKKVSFYEKRGGDKGVYFMSGLNLKKLQKKSSSYDFYTRIVPVGADGLTIESVNGGKNYLENHQYSGKVRTYIWKDESYTDAQALKEDAQKKLEDLSKPEVSYAADVRDLAKQKPGYSILSYKLGDTVTLVDRDTGTKEKQRVMRLVEYEADPDKNTCELGNTFLTFEEMQEKLRAAAELAGNTITGDGKIYVSNILNFEKGLSESVTVGGIRENVSTMQGDMATMQGDIAEVKAKFGELDVNFLTAEEAAIKYATIEQLNATNETVHSIQGDYAGFKTLTAQEFATQTGIIDNLSGQFSSYKTQMAQEMVAAKGWMLEGAIGSAQISDLDVNKLKAGTLNTSIVNIAGSDGRLQIIDNTIQISDEDRVRVQVGKDASGDYTLAVWDSAGNLIWDALGATENTIQRKIIRDKMVADDANIQALKIDFQSFDTALTEQGVVISGTVVQVGSKTLEVALSEQEQTIGDYGETLSSHDARITANEKSISLKVSTQDFTTYQTTVTGQISAAKSEAISTAASDASTKADNAKSAAVTAAASDATAKANQALADAKSYTNAEITTVNKSLSTTNQEISVMQGQIALKVEQTDIDTAVTNIEIGGRNLFKGYDDGEIRLKDYNNTGSFTQFFNLAFDPADYVGEKFTISFYAKSPNGTTQLRLYNANNSPRYFCFSTTLDNALGTDWKYYTYTFVNVDRGSSYAVSNKVEIYAPDKMGVLVKKIKVEKGNKATDWTPAPEDVDASITAVDNKFASYSTTTQMQSAIDLAKNAITQSVSETYATKSQVNTVSGNVTTLTSRVSAAESKLTKDSLVTTIGSYYATQTALNTTNSNVTAAQSTADTAKSNAAAAQTTANNAYNLANAKGIDYSQGKMLHTDPMFASGTNSCSAYNNSSNGTVTVTRTAKSSDNPMTGTSYELMIKTAGTASPGLGGYVQSVSSRANAVFIRRIIAKIPTGYTLAYAQNAMGTGYTVQWLTPNAGTGKFTEYVYKYVCGPTGTFSNGGHVYLSGAAATSASPVTWYVAYSTTFDMTNVSDAILAQTVASQTSEKFNWIVKSGTSATDFTLTDRTATLVANAINLNGLVTFSGLDSTAQGKITAAQSTADTAKANAATAQGTADTANTRATYHYGTCATAAATAAKAVTLSGFALYTGATISVKFTYANTAASPTLNVNSTGAKPIYVYGAALAASSAYNWVAGATVQFTYNGTQWVMTDTSAMKAVANWCYSNNLSYINGANIYAGTVTAKQINVNDLFAQDITATGTITGVNLVGARGSFTGSVVANDIVIKETIKMRGTDSTVDRNAVMLEDYGGTLKIDIGDPEIDTSQFQTFVALNGNTILLNGTVQAYGGGIDASTNQIKCGAFKCSTVDSAGEIRSTSPNAFRAVYGNYGSFIRNDGANTYFLVTNSGDPYGSFNSLRPLYFSNSTGAVTMGNGAVVNGNLNATTVSTYSGNYKPVGSRATDKYRTNEIATNVNGSGTYYISVSGQYGSTAYSSKNFTATTSDIRLKTDIVPTEVEALPIIQQLQMWKFRWKETGIVQNIGFIADELELIDPALTIGGGYNQDGSLNAKGVNEFYLTGIITKGIQELCTIGNKRDMRVNEQESRIESLQYQLNEARAQIAQQAAELARLKGMLQAAA